VILVTAIIGEGCKVAGEDKSDDRKTGVVSTQSFRSLGTADRWRCRCDPCRLPPLVRCQPRDHPLFCAASPVKASLAKAHGSFSEVA
jgi:hypothetical protein